MTPSATRAASAVPPAIRAFDRLADQYDALCAGDIMTMMRRRTHERMARRFPPGSRILEIGCGTGLDTGFLASMGAHVVAADPSARMLDRTRARLRATNNMAHLIRCGAEELDQHLGPATFEGIVSNFGALNCVEDLGQVASLARDRLVPGGWVMLGLLTRTCAWEIARGLLRGRPREAFRRLGVRPMIDLDGIEVPAYYHRVGDVLAVFGASFVVGRAEGLGVFVPPSRCEDRWRRLPSAVRRAACRTEASLGPWFPFNRLGDYVFLELHRDSRRSGAGRA